MIDVLACELVAWLKDAFPAMTIEQERELLWRLASIESEARAPGGPGPIRAGAIRRLLLERRQPRLFIPVSADLSELAELSPQVAQAGLSQWAREIRTNVLKPKK